MKKKILALFCACALCLGLLVFPPSLAVGDTPCFLAINDSLQLLEDRTIPIAIDGLYYVPYTALDSNVTQGVSLGIFPVYNAAQNTLMIYSFDKTLVFDLTYGTCKDRNGVSLNARAVNRNGRIYVPARFICEQFGLTYSSRTTIYGPLVRLRNASSRIDDANFVGLAQQMMESRLREWRKSQAEASSVTPTPSQTPPPVTTPVAEDPNVDKSGVHTYLAFRADQTDGLEELLTTLEQYQVQALFFFPAAELADYDDAVRRVLCGGHSVGLLVSGATGADAAGQAGEGNRILAQIAYLHTNILLASEVEDETAEEELTAAGWLCWSTDVDALPDGRGAYRQASAVLGSVDLYHSEVYILSDASADGAALLERLLPSLIESRYNLRLAVETEL